MTRRKTLLIVSSACYLLAASFLALYWVSASSKPNMVKLGFDRYLIKHDGHYIYRDDIKGFEVELPSKTFVLDSSREQVVLGRGVYGDPDYMLYITTETYDPGIPEANYLAAQHEGASLQGPAGSELTFTQVFDQGEIAGVQKVYERRFPVHEVEEQFVFANDGHAVFMRFQYPADVRSSLESEMVWSRSTLRFHDN